MTTGLPGADGETLFFNPMASRLAWIRRVLAEAHQTRHPELERVKFLAIAATLLDEFFEIPVAALLQRIEDGALTPDASGLDARAELSLVDRETHALTGEMHRCWNQQVRPALAARGVRWVNWKQLEASGRRASLRFYRQEVDPLITPVVINPARPFPRVGNKGLCLAFRLRRRRARFLGILTLPRTLPRWLRLPGVGKEECYLPLASLVTAQADELFQGYEVTDAAAFRITRNSNLYLNEEEARSILDLVSGEVLNRRKGDVVRLEIESGAPAGLAESLRANFKLDAWQVFEAPAPVNLPRLLDLWRLSQRAELKFPPLRPRVPDWPREPKAWFERLRRGDLLLHHPYESYAPVNDFLQLAARDPRVQALRMTLYRTDEHSSAMRALAEAAVHKDVAAVVEIKARFDELSNIGWARSLEASGVRVFHGIVGLKTHCKLALIIRRDEDGKLRRYAHLGTGNYNSETARQYTDLSLFTSHPGLTTGAEEVFRYLTASTRPRRRGSWLVQAPEGLARRLLGLIEREAVHARQGRPARIMARMNGLLDPEIILALYRASRAGVEIDLIVRGVCALRPGLRGISDRIRVKSVTGRFLEHTRALWVANAGAEEVYAGSADWMPRNLHGRVEVMFPILDAEPRRRVRDETLRLYLADDLQSWWLLPDGRYVRMEQLPLRQRRKVLAAQRQLLGAIPASGVSAQDHLLHAVGQSSAASPNAAGLAPPAQ